MLTYPKTDFRRWSLLVLMSLLPLCACSAGNADATAEGTAKNETVESTVSEEKSPLGSWGAILPAPEGIFVGVGTVYRNSGQEIIIRYSFGGWNKTTTRFYNFSQGKLEIECKNDECSKEVISGLNKLEEEKISFSKYTSFGGGFRRRTSGGTQGSTPMDDGYETLLQNNTVSYEKIIWLTDKKAESLIFRFYALDDNIVLGLAVNNPIVIVFKNNLTSPYFKNNKTLIKMDGNLADSIYRVCSADARVNNPGRNIMEASGACFAETIKNGVSDDLKKALEKRIEQFYVKKESGETTHRINGGWGMFLPLPEEYNRFDLWHVYLNAKQEIIILYVLNTKEDKFWRVFNLSRGILEHEYRVVDDQKTQPWIDEKIAGFNRINSLPTDGRAPAGEGFSLDKRSRGIHALRKR